MTKGKIKKKGSRRLQTKRGVRPGSVPGQVVSHSSAEQPTISVMAYNETALIEKHGSLDEIRSLKEEHELIWINVVGLGDADVILELGKILGLHQLALEDVVNTHQRPKVEEFSDHVFIVAQMLCGGDYVNMEQVSFFLGKGYLLTFQERDGDCFDPVRERIRKSKGRIRSEGVDYLCYALLDSIIDLYFPALEIYGDALEVLEDSVVSRPEAGQISELHDMKRDLLLLRRAIWPHRDMVNNLIRDESDLISASTKTYLRDCYDHTFQLMDIVETYREIASGLVDVYISSVSAKLNEVMKVLTIIATVFMPLSFIASLYGMNFDREASSWNMPELGWSFGYVYALMLMAFSAGGFLWYFKRKGWLDR